MQLLRLPEGVPDGMEVFLLTLDLEVSVPDGDWSVLGENEGVRAERYRQHADKVRFVRTRAALRRLLAERLRLRSSDLTFVANRYGKPGLVPPGSADPAYCFNVSHAGSHALIALSRRRPVGVDIERRDRNLNVPGLERQVLSQLERNSSAGERLEFFDCWSAKEAALKALGLGVAEHLQRLSVLSPKVSLTTGERHRDHYRLHYDGTEWPPLGACRLSAPDGYAATLAWVGASAKELS